MRICAFQGFVNNWFVNNWFVNNQMLHESLFFACLFGVLQKQMNARQQTKKQSSNHQPWFCHPVGIGGVAQQASRDERAEKITPRPQRK